MEMKEAQKLYKKALELKGELSQILICIEEMGELNQALIKYVRNEGYEKVVLKDKIIEELADVQIMVEQLVVSFNIKDEFELERARKLERLKKRLEIMENKDNGH